jgi:hypothetical protein
MRSLNSTVGSKKYNTDIKLLRGVSQWRFTPGVNGEPFRILEKNKKETTQ